MPFFLRAGERRPRYLALWPRPLRGSPARRVAMGTQRPRQALCCAVPRVAFAYLAPATVGGHGAFEKLGRQDQEAEGPGPLPAFLLAGHRVRRCGRHSAVRWGLR